MTTDHKRATEAPAGEGPAEPPGLLWTRPGKSARPQLTRDAIVDAAVALADAEGLEAASIRRVAAALEVNPMRIYTHIERKDDLFELMVDRVAGEAVVAGPQSEDWREALRAIAERSRASCLRHPWVMNALRSWPRLGPNTMRHLEQSLAALASLDVDHRRKIEILGAVDTFVVGHLTTELSERAKTARFGGDDASWRKSVRGYVDDLVATGNFPHLAALGPDLPVPLARERPEERFVLGLEWLLAGIAAAVEQAAN